MAIINLSLHFVRLVCWGFRAVTAAQIPRKTYQYNCLLATRPSPIVWFHVWFPITTFPKMQILVAICFVTGDPAISQQEFINGNLIIDFRVLSRKSYWHLPQKESLIRLLFPGLTRFYDARAWLPRWRAVHVRAKVTYRAAPPMGGFQTVTWCLPRVPCSLVLGPDVKYRCLLLSTGGERTWCTIYRD